jgi:putative FmdB family regulatory protein
MPIYEYRREDGSTFEVIQKFSDDALTKDPDTGKPVERVYTAPAIHFKGSGFHNTDYGSNRRPKAGSGGESSSKDSTTTEKPASKPSDSKSESKGKSGETSKSKGDAKK